MEEWVIFSKKRLCKKHLEPVKSLVFYILVCFRICFYIFSVAHIRLCRGM